MKTPKPSTKSKTRQAEIDLQVRKIEDKRLGKENTIRALTTEIIDLRKENAAFREVKNHTPQFTKLKPKKASGKSESVCVLVASDWHTEERVRKGDVSGKNEFNMDIAAQRIDRFFQGGLRLYQMMARDTNIPTIILALLGDYISSNIHDELVELAQMPPCDAISWAQDKIIQGIQFLLDNTTDVELLIVCHSGNHGRITKQQRNATGEGNSLEGFMYRNIRSYFKDDKRIKWQIAEGYHTITSLWDGKFKVRFHHGHAMNYGGGVGGITIPVRKKIAQWNKVEWCNLDVFGHFHQFTDAADFVCNGSLIGYNGYAVSIGADYEAPKQGFLLINKKHGKAMVTPIFVGED